MAKEINSLNSEINQFKTPTYVAYEKVQILTKVIFSLSREI